MDIYILRHGEAQAGRAGLADKDRKLTPKGKEGVQAVAAFARKIKLEPHMILTSPLVRAQETAAVFAKAFPETPVRETESLVPGASPDLIWKEIGAMKEVEQVILVGHEPHLGHLAAFLLEAAVAVDLKKGSLLRIATGKRIGPPRGVLKWMITPRLAKLLS